MTCCFLIQWWLGERKKECSASYNWSRPFQNVHPPTGKREKWKMVFIIIIVEGKKGTKLFDSRKAYLPELRPDLVTALSGLYVDDFTVIT
jgi:hypothetical protein